MEKLLETLEKIGVPADEIERIRTHYEADAAGLRKYVLYMRAILDDRHEYV